MAEIKLIITDLDDTFLDGEYAPDMNVAAIAHARDEGIRVLPCTGRPWVMAEDVIKGYDFDDLCVVSNGAAIMEVKTGRVRHSSPIVADTVLPLLQLAVENDVAFDITCGSFIAMLNSRRRVRRGKMYDDALPVLGEAGKLAIYESPEAMAADCGHNAELVRYFMHADDPAADVVTARLAEIAGIGIARSHRYHLDIMAAGVNKGAALPVLAGIYGIGLENIMALGDQMNDAQMLQAAGLGVAMGNADNELKILADCVTDTNKNAGFAKAIYQYAL